MESIEIGAKQETSEDYYKKMRGKCGVQSVCQLSNNWLQNTILNSTAWWGCIFYTSQRNEINEYSISQLIVIEKWNN